jgi:hypothetical protein
MILHVEKPKDYTQGDIKMTNYLCLFLITIYHEIAEVD